MRVKSLTSYNPSGSITAMGLHVASGHCNRPSTERQSSQRPEGRGTETSMCAIACVIGTGPVKLIPTIPRAILNSTAAATSFPPVCLSAQEPSALEYLYVPRYVYLPMLGEYHCLRSLSSSRRHL